MVYTGNRKGIRMLLFIIVVCVTVYLCLKKEIPKLGKVLIGIAGYFIGFFLFEIEVPFSLPSNLDAYLTLLWFLSIPAFFIVLIVFLVQRHKQSLSVQIQQKEMENQNLMYLNAALRHRIDRQTELESKGYVTDSERKQADRSVKELEDQVRYYKLLKVLKDREEEEERQRKLEEEEKQRKLEEELNAKKSKSSEFDWDELFEYSIMMDNFNRHEKDKKRK